MPRGLVATLFDIELAGGRIDGLGDGHNLLGRVVRIPLRRVVADNLRGGNIPSHIFAGIIKTDALNIWPVSTLGALRRIFVDETMVCVLLLNVHYLCFLYFALIVI